MISSVTKNEFEAILKEEKLVLVDFWADWCAPCKMMGVILEDVLLEIENEVKIIKINIDSDEEVAQEYSIMSIPTLLLFKEGKEIGRNVGVRPKEDVITFVQSGL